MNLTNESLKSVGRWLVFVTVVAGVALPDRLPGEKSEPAETGASSPDDAVTCLINRLVERGVLEATDAKELSEITGEKDVVVGLIRRLVKKGVLEAVHPLAGGVP